ncbi:MAG: hypothetical protein C4540_00355 [Candidatus Omnitrophota bacterium]|jgi:hypothetical protein|nr:MAG: hypothetical protein C4540_00355 [Candidatus Omnitrophota bacterium]
MKTALIVILAIAVIILGFSASSLQKELFSSRESAAFSDKRSEDLQRELMRLNKLYADKERFLSEIEQSIEELDSKVDLKTLERHIPKKEWDEIKPIIDRLRAFQQERKNEKNN